MIVVTNSVPLIHAMMVDLRLGRWRLLSAAFSSMPSSYPIAREKAPPGEGEATLRCRAMPSGAKT